MLDQERNRHMNALVETQRDKLIYLCREYAVKKLELFGSAAVGDFDLEKSDLDFLVDFEPCTPVLHAERYLGLLAAMQDSFGRNIDLVEIRAMRNPYFIQSIESDRQIVYAK